jgi:hypothetical protein
VYLDKTWIHLAWKKCERNNSAGQKWICAFLFGEVFFPEEHLIFNEGRSVAVTVSKLTSKIF